MTVDAMGERYGLLPSEVLRRATTLDLFIVDTALGYRNSVNERAAAQRNPRPSTDYTEDELLKIMEETRGEINQSKS